MSDRAGARRAFGTGIGLFVAASAACGLAPTIGTLVAARFAYGAIEGGAAAFTTFRVITAFVVAAVALAAFLLAQARGRHPMAPLEMFRARNVTVAVVVGFAFIVGYYGLPFVMSLDLQQQRGLSPLGTGVAFLPMMLTGLILTPFSARIAERAGARLLITGGLTLMAAGLAAVAAVPAAPVWVLAALMALVGLGGPLVMPPVTGVLLNSVPDHRSGTASGVFNTSRQAGGALAVAVFGALLAGGGGFTTGLRVSLFIAAAVALAAAGAAAALRAPRAAAPGHGRVSVSHTGRPSRKRPASEPQEA